MFIHPSIDPVAFHLGPLAVHWYGLTYLFSFVAAWWLLRYRIKAWNLDWSSELLADLVFYGALGVILGGRLGYVLFYNLPYYAIHPFQIFSVWDGGMSFHGGMLGVMAAIGLWCWRYKKNYLVVTDFVAPVVPIGLGAGRIGNFINGELWGRVTEVSWAMIYPSVDALPRHPSELYEFLLEGVLLFIILWLYSSKRPPKMAVSGLFLVLYGLFRFVCEYFRQPDAQLGFIAFDWLTMGQILCLPMVILGFILLTLAYVRQSRGS